MNLQLVSMSCAFHQYVTDQVEIAMIPFLCPTIYSNSIYSSICIQKPGTKWWSTILLKNAGLLYNVRVEQRWHPPAFNGCSLHNGTGRPTSPRRSWLEMGDQGQESEKGVGMWWWLERDIDGLLRWFVILKNIVLSRFMVFCGLHEAIILGLMNDDK